MMRSFLLSLFICLPLFSQEIQTFYGPIEVDGQILRLTEYDPSYREEYNNTKQLMQNGWAIKLNTEKENHMPQEKAPQYLYKILSAAHWKQSQDGTCLVLDGADQAFIHLFREDQLERILTKYWANRTDFFVLKIDTEKLKGDLIYEANPGGVNKYYHLYEGLIPLEAVVEARSPARK